MAIPQRRPRDVQPIRLPGRADALIGLRRVGKTSVCFRWMQALLDAGVARTHVLYLNLEDDRLAPLESDSLARLFDAWVRQVPSVRDGGAHLFLDEIQVAPQWERFVRRLLDREQVQVTITGSSAELLSGELATSLRGRSNAIEVLPLSFSEHLAWRDVAVESKSVSDGLRVTLEAEFDAWLERGGMPELAELDPPLRQQMLQQAVEAVTLRDVAQRHGITRLDALELVVRQVLANTARAASARRLAEAAGMGGGNQRQEVSEWLRLLEGAFLIGRVEIDDATPARRRRLPAKFHAADTGMALAHQRPDRQDLGHLLETAVYWSLRRVGWELHRMVLDGDRELDLLAEDRRGVQHLVQVCADLSDPSTRARELAAIDAAMEQTGEREASLVTVREAGELRLANGRVSIVPAWRWFLAPPHPVDVAAGSDALQRR